MPKVQPKNIYLDYSSTTPIHPEIIKDTQVLMEEYYENADSLHYGGKRVYELVEKSRKALADYFKVLPHEVIFTSGGTESNNNAIKGIALANMSKGKHIVTSRIEHSSVYDSVRWLEEHFGFEVSYVPVNEYGVVDAKELAKYLRKDTILVSLMHVNNETGAIMDIPALVEQTKSNSNAYIHIDAVQALGKHDISLNRIDSMSFSSHKIGGLKGSGLWIKKDHVQSIPLISGGQQENGNRGGTLNHIPAILWYKTLRLALEKRSKDLKHIQEMKDKLNRAFEEDAEILINSGENTSPYIFNISFQKVGSEILLNGLESAGYSVSAQATCNSRSLKPSRILLAMGRDEFQAKNSIRISLDGTTTTQQIEELIETLTELKKYATT